MLLLSAHRSLSESPSSLQTQKEISSYCPAKMIVLIYLDACAVVHLCCFRLCKKKACLNLTPLQLSAMKKLRTNNSLIIKPADKNLGLAVMDTKTYIKQVLQEHLLTSRYQQLSKQDSLNRLENFEATLKDLISSNLNYLSKSEVIYFQRSFKIKHRLPIFYGLPKVHKIPITLRPVVSSVNSFSSVFSNWLDFKMKDLLPLVKSYTKNSSDVINDLKNLDIPENARLFSADAKSMYTNIDTNVGIQSFQDFLPVTKQRYHKISL
jgi:hypothetical protein